MSQNLTLTEFLNALVTERAELDNVNVDGIVEARLAEIAVKVRAEVESELAQTKYVADIKISTLQEAIARVAEAESAETTEELEETPEVVTETY